MELVEASSCRAGRPCYVGGFVNSAKKPTARKAGPVMATTFSSLLKIRAQAILKVAQETVNTRQHLVDQATALAQSNLKSGLDVSFATVNLAQAKLPLVQAQLNKTEGEIQQTSAKYDYQSLRALLNFQVGSLH